MRFFLFTLLLVYNLSNAQTHDSNLELKLVYLDADLVAKHEIINQIESFYRLSINPVSSIIKNEANSIDVVEFMKSVQDTLPKELDYFYLFFTNRPIFIGQTEFTLRGFSSKHTAIVSTFKIEAETQTPDEYERILFKTFLHETGHLLGLKHCSNSKNCFMVTSFPESLFLNSDNLLCDSCANLINIYLR